MSLALHAVAECMRACSPRDRAESRSTGRAARPSGRASATARVKGAPVVASKQAKPGADDAARAVFNRMGVRPAKTGARRDDQEDTDAQCTYSVSGSHFMEQHGISATRATDQLRACAVPAQGTMLAMMSCTAARPLLLRLRCGSSNRLDVAVSAVSGAARGSLRALRDAGRCQGGRVGAFEHGGARACCAIVRSEPS